MKKTYAVVVGLVVFSISSFWIIGSEIYGQRNQVTITERVLEGDKRSAEGLTILARNQFEEHLFWETTYRIGEDAKCETEYSFYQAAHEEQEAYIYRGMELFEYVPYEPVSRDWQIGSNREISELQKEYEKLEVGLKAGERRSKTLYLKDYYEYYPLHMTIDLPNTVWTSEEPGTEVGEEPFDPKYVKDKFDAFFKIPVLESDYITIYVSQEGNSENGYYVNTSKGSDDKCYFDMHTVSAYNDTTCYFAFSNRKEIMEEIEGDQVYTGREYVDTSLIPGGYGIYAFSYGRREGEYHTGIDADSLQMVYSLPQEVAIKHMMIRNEQSQMVLLVEENRSAYVWVIDLETMELIQQFLLDEKVYRRTDPYVEVLEFDDFIAVLFEGEIAIISDEKGSYAHEFTVEIEERVTNDWFGMGRVMDFDGQKLAIVGDKSGYWGSYESCDFYVAVYDHTGLLYYGQYESSLSEKTNSNSYRNVYPTNIDAYTIRW